MKVILALIIFFILLMPAYIVNELISWQQKNITNLIIYNLLMLCCYMPIYLLSKYTIKNKNRRKILFLNFMVTGYLCTLVIKPIGLFFPIGFSLNILVYLILNSYENKN